MNTLRLFRAALHLALALICIPATALAESDIPGGKDHPMFSRIPGYYISAYKEEEFAAYDFTNEKGEEVTVEGQLTEITYTLPDSAPRGATLKIVRNFTNAVKKLGGKSYEYAGNTNYLNIIKEGREVWVRVYASEDDYTLTILQKGEVKQEITADWMLEELNRSGHVALYIHFDTGKAVIRPESEAVVRQIVTMLRDHADLNILVEGHTDDVGADDANLKLSKQRAEAVVQVIVAQGIAQQRLSAAGFGEKKPIADNKTEKGRAKNRRVELVKK
ncbi:MAG: OmpA family protein [Desulfobacterales bacterium CG07_land_8_20_14_0_80_52_14]|nr:MAG: OmpA family protein [Desulfobacterales bacterium CG07_land_8_20_14_0_80_52_14]